MSTLIWEEGISHEGMNHPGLTERGWGQPGVKLGVIHVFLTSSSSGHYLPQN
jgi:hypothetical protein